MLKMEIVSPVHGIPHECHAGTVPRIEIYGFLLFEVQRPFDIHAGNPILCLQSGNKILERIHFDLFGVGDLVLFGLLERPYNTVFVQHPKLRHFFKNGSRAVIVPKSVAVHQNQLFVGSYKQPQKSERKAHRIAIYGLHKPIVLQQMFYSLFDTHVSHSPNFSV
jgi:hypothetical protein